MTLMPKKSVPMRTRHSSRSIASRTVKYCVSTHGAKLKHGSGTGPPASPLVALFRGRESRRERMVAPCLVLLSACRPPRWRRPENRARSGAMAKYVRDEDAHDHLLARSDIVRRALVGLSRANNHCWHCGGHEALLKYILRPPLSTERLLPGPDGLVRIALKKPFSDGTVAVDLDPLSLLCRLVALVPAPLGRHHRPR